MTASDGADPLTPRELVARVASVVEDIPPGRTMSYGDIGRIIGAGPRQVGRVLATASAGWTWWRVTRSDGTLPPDLQHEALQHYREESTPVRNGHADRRASRWDPWEDAEF